MKITLELTVEQAYALMDALELYSRIKMGQLDWAEYVLSLDTYDKTLHRPKYDQELARQYLEKAKQTIFPYISPSAYIGIQGTSERSRISWDIYQQLRHNLTIYKHPNPSIEERGKAYDKPFKVSDEPLPAITIAEE
jgi:hypothetical protein